MTDWLRSGSLSFPPPCAHAMAAIAGSRSHSGEPPSKEDVADLLDNLTMDEGELAALSDDGDGEDAAVVKWAVIGKDLSPSTLHINSIRNAMRPAWGNPFGLKFRSVGDNGCSLLNLVHTVVHC